MTLSADILRRLDLPECPLCGARTRLVTGDLADDLEKMGAEYVRRCASGVCSWWIGTLYGLVVERQPAGMVVRHPSTGEEAEA